MLGFDATFHPTGSHQRNEDDIDGTHIYYFVSAYSNSTSLSVEIQFIIHITGTKLSWILAQRTWGFLHHSVNNGAQKRRFYYFTFYWTCARRFHDVVYLRERWVSEQLRTYMCPQRARTHNLSVDQKYF